MVFKRKAYDTMLQWKEEQAGRTALLLKGARRVGKTTLVREFASREYRSHILLDFARASREVLRLFEDLSDLDDFFAKLQVLTHTQLHRRQSVIVMDEIQLFPPARQAVKYLVEDGRYDYIETGSLLSIKKNTAGILIPSEETRITLNPLDYEEFSDALGDSGTCPMLREWFQKRKPLGEAVNRKIMRDFRNYMLVGGMPQAVASYVETRNFQKVDQVKRGILELYEDDFRKIDASGDVSRLFRNIPSELGKYASKYQISSVLNGKKWSDAATRIGDLADSQTVNLAYHADDPNVGMGLSRDLRRFKIYLADTGLFTTLVFMDKSFTENVIYQKLLAGRLEANLGFLYKNMIAQMLQAKGETLYYYTFPQESSNHLYEVDFLLSRGNKLCPVEVKSSGYRTHASLDAFARKFTTRIQQKILLYTKDLAKDHDILMLPVFMAMFL